jgi:hypothetical protein
MICVMSPMLLSTVVLAAAGDWIINTVRTRRHKVGLEKPMSLLSRGNQSNSSTGKVREELDAHNNGGEIARCSFSATGGGGSVVYIPNHTVRNNSHEH